MPEITVLMPVRNGERYIKESIDSVLNQTLTDFEFLIIDDGSTDRTVENGLRFSAIRATKEMFPTLDMESYTNLCWNY